MGQPIQIRSQASAPPDFRARQIVRFAESHFQGINIMNALKRTTKKELLYCCFFGLISISLLSACSSSGQVKILSPLEGTARIDHNATAILEVVPGKGLQPDEDLREMILNLRGQLFGRLVSDGIFKQVVHEGDPAKYYIRVYVNIADQVSMGARIMFGVFAGANELSVRVEVFEESSENSIMTFTASGESASHLFSGESEMEDAIREVVNKIILSLMK